MGGSDADDVELPKVFSRAVLDWEDSGLRETPLRIAAPSLLPGPEILRRVDHRIERFGGDLQRLTGLDLLHHHGSAPDPQAREIARLVDPLHVHGHRSLDESLGLVVFVIPVSDP